MNKDFVFIRLSFQISIEWNMISDISFQGKKECPTDKYGHKYKPFKDKHTACMGKSSKATPIG